MIFLFFFYSVDDTCFSLKEYALIANIILYFLYLAILVKMILLKKFLANEFRDLDLQIEIKKTWGMKTTAVPVIIGALGLVKKAIENYIGKIPGNIRITELQKTVLLGTTHILRRTLSIKYSSTLMTALGSWIELGTISEKSKT